MGLELLKPEALGALKGKAAAAERAAPSKSVPVGA
jgi:hypothetical protein